MQHLLFYFLFMFLTGTTNAMYYKKNKITYTTLITTLNVVLLVYTIYHTISNLSGIGAFVLIISLTLPHYFNHCKLEIFKNDDSNKIHLNEYLLSSSFVLSMFLFGKIDGLMYVCGMHLGGVIFNLMINKVHSGQFLEKVDYTDDPTGKTVGVYIGTHHFRIPRISNSYIKLYLGLFLTSLWIANQYTYKYEITVDLFNKTFILFNKTFTFN